MVDRIALLLYRWRWHCLVLAAILGTLAQIPASWLVLDRRIENMFSARDPLLPSHLKLKRIFSGNDIVLAVYEDPDLLRADQSGMNRLETIRKRLESVPGVMGVLSLDMPIGKDVVDEERPVGRKIQQLFQGYTHGADGKTVCVACMLAPANAGTATRDTTIRTLRRMMRELPDGLSPGIITGEPVMLHDAFLYIEEDGVRLVWFTTLLLGLVIFVLVRSWKWVLLPLLIVQLSLSLTNGLLGLIGVSQSMVSSMLTAVITVVGIGTVMHVIIRYREAVDCGLGPSQALVHTMRILSVPVFYACVTDAFGFGALMVAAVAPVRDFGFMMAIGSIMVLVSCALLIPALASLGERSPTGNAGLKDELLDGPLLWLVRMAEHHGGKAALATLGFSALCIAGVSRLENETDFTRNFRKSTEIVRSYEIVESRLGGAGVCEVILPAAEPLSWQYLAKVLKFEARLRREVVLEDGDGTKPGLTKVLSLADFIYRVAPSDLSKVRREKLRHSLIATGLNMMRKSIPQFYAALHAVDPDHPGDHWFRIMLRANERQPSHQKQEIIAQVRKIAAEDFPEAEVTGYFVLLTNLIDSLLRDQWRSFAVAIVSITIVMMLALWDIRLVLISLVPNVIPILIVNGMMGWCGFKMNMGAAMICAVSIGLSIDGSIHYLVAYQRARKVGMSVSQALHDVQKSVGKSMVYSTFALCVGFSALATSQFVPTVYFGVLVSLSMLCTLLGSLLWLPLLVKAFVRDDNKEGASPRLVAAVSSRS